MSFLCLRYIFHVCDQVYVCERMHASFWVSRMGGPPQPHLEWNDTKAASQVLARHEGTESNLRREAESLGVNGDRITALPVQGKAAHLKRFASASVFLDTFPYGAHTTCTEALYAGVLRVKGQASMLCSFVDTRRFL